MASFGSYHSPESGSKTIGHHHRFDAITDRIFVQIYPNLFKTLAQLPNGIKTTNTFLNFRNHRGPYSAVHTPSMGFKYGLLAGHSSFVMQSPNSVDSNSCVSL